MTPVDPTAAVVAELAGIRNNFAQFGRDIGDVKTSVAVLVERSTRTDADVRLLRDDTERELQEIRKELSGLQRWRWMSTGAASILGVAAGYAAQLLAH